MGGRMATRFSSLRVVASVVALLLLVSGACLAEDDAPADSMSKTALRAGAKALQFQIDNNFHLSSFDGTTISLTKQKSPNSAIRIGLSISGSLSNSDQNDDDQTNTRRITVGDRNDNNISVNLNALCLRYRTATNGSINPYVGIGPTIGFSRNKTEASGTTYYTDATIESTSSDRRYTLTGGIASAVGVEWFVSKSLSLTAEYGVQLVYVYTDRDSSSRSTRITEDSTSVNSSDGATISREFALDSRPVKFGGVGLRSLQGESNSVQELVSSSFQCPD
jgi:opacity protein-like surface antigen